MEDKILEIARRVACMRDILGIGPDEMAGVLGMSQSDYLSCESGKTEFSLSSLYKAADRFQIDLTELLAGTSPKLTDYAITRRQDGLTLERRKGFEYKSLAYRFRHRSAEVFMVSAKYRSEEASSAILSNSHDGQEFDYVLEGCLRVVIGGHEEILYEGDMIYYNSSTPHGMAPVDGDCKFLAVLIKGEKNA